MPKFKNIEPLKITQIAQNYELVGKNDNNCMVFYSGDIFCFEGTKKDCLAYIKSQPKTKPKPKTKNLAFEFIHTEKTPKIEKPKKEIKEIKNTIIQNQLLLF